MHGFLYRDLRIMRTTLIIYGVFCIPIAILIPIVRALCWTSSELSNIIEYDFPCLISYGVLMFFAYYFQGTLLKSDQQPLPTYFAISSPAGVKGYVKSKYILCFLLGFVMMNICIVTDLIANAIINTRTGFIPTSFITVSTSAFLMTLLLNAAEIPFILRFGYKKGINLKAGIFVTLIVVIGIYFLFGDISMFGSMEDFMQFLIAVLKGERGGTTLIAISAIAPIVVGILYFLSYKLSCKLYLKGVEFLEQ